MDSKKTYKTIKSLEFQLMVYPNNRQQILDNAGKKIEINKEDIWFVMAEDGDCALFDKNGKTPKSYLRFSLAKQICDSAFEKMGYYPEKITLPEGIDKIGDSCFEDRMRIKEVVLPNSLTYIDQWAFAGCSELSSIIFNDGLKYVANHAFGWTNIKDVQFPDSIVFLGSKLFIACDNLSSVSLHYRRDLTISDLAFTSAKYIKRIVFKCNGMQNADHEIRRMRGYPFDANPKTIQIET